jgi:hypothetical protein
MSSDSGLIAVRPVLSYPRRARAGQTYLLTIDLLGDDGAPWPYPQEEYVVYCLLRTLPLFEHRALGSGGVVLHRFGGTYGPAQFLLTACDVEQEGTIRVTLVNGWGVPVSTLDLPGIRVGQGPEFAPDPGEPRGRIHIDRPDTTRGGRAIEPSSPYRGLEPFREQDAELFRGFDKELEAIWQHLNQTKRETVFVDGSPGSGKTSLLQAGIIPRVRREGLLGRNDWQVVSFRPGISPVENFLNALHENGPEGLRIAPSTWGEHHGKPQESMSIEQILRRDGPMIDSSTWEGQRGNPPESRPIEQIIRRGAASYDDRTRKKREDHLNDIRRAILDRRNPLFIVLDQFEEFYTRCPDAKERDAILMLLGNLLRQEDSREEFRLLVGIRTGDLGIYVDARIFGGVPAFHVALTPPASEDLRKIVVEPAQHLGYRFQGALSDNDPRHEMSLVDRILSDPLLAPNAFTGLRGPDDGQASRGLLQLALRDLWNQAAVRGSKEFTHADYDQVGGLGTTLGRRTEEVFLLRMNVVLPPQAHAQDIARQILTGLVSNDRPLLRPREELEAQTGNRDRTTTIVESLLEARILVMLTGNPDPAVPLVTLAHPALIQHWPRLRGWLEGRSPVEENPARETPTPESTTPKTAEGSQPARDRVQAPMFVIPFDKNIECLDQAARKALVAEMGRGQYTDLFVLTHGWNLDWNAAKEFCERFFTGFLTLHQQSAPAGRPFRPLLAGILWESLAFGPAWEGPSASGATAEGRDGAENREEMRQIAGELKESDVPRFYELAGKSGLDAQEGLELARILAPIYQDPDDPQGRERSPEELVALWEQQGESLSTESAPGRGSGRGVLRGWFDTILSPLRVTSFWMMLDRAGKVGTRGFNPLLIELLNAGTATHLHLVAHSFGARLMLGALCAETLPRRVDSLLLIQAAVPHLCFARDLTDRGDSGEYCNALDRVELPILTTFSRNDPALVLVFARSIQVSPPAYLRNVRVSARPHDLYAALGAVGPQGCEKESRYAEMIRPPGRYDLRPGSEIRLIALDGGDYIHGHWDINNTAVWWALCNLADAGREIKG